MKKKGDSGSSMCLMGADGRYQSIGVTSFVASAGCQSGLPDGFVSFLKMTRQIEKVERKNTMQRFIFIFNFINFMVYLIAVILWLQ